MGGKVAFADQRITIQNFQIGQSYSRPEIAVTGEVSAPTNSRDPHWSQGIVPFSNAVLLLVTLDKSDRDNYQYDDRFEGDTFWWDSQNSQTQKSPVIANILRDALEPHLFVRVKEKVRGSTQRFTYCGRLSEPIAEGDRPVKVLFQCPEYVQSAEGNLRAVYDWKPSGAADRKEGAREEAIRERRGRGQGYQVDQQVKEATEQLAMEAAKRHYISLGFDVDDVHKYKSYDLVVTKDGKARRVEVKGTQSAGESVELTRGEVEAARAGPEPTDLFVWCEITITREEGVAKASGGAMRLISGWQPLDTDLLATRFTYQVPSEAKTAKSSRRAGKRRR
ncbi:MAG TPA: DUF3427 domain-containing protein [Steroidobacteraceae bacterium]